MNGKTNKLSPKGKKIYLKKGKKILNRNMKEKNTDRERRVMKTCPSTLSAKIAVTQNTNHTG
jgi:hypothetical protein